MQSGMMRTECYQSVLDEVKANANHANANQADANQGESHALEDVTRWRRS